MQGHSKKTTDKRAFFWMSITLESSLQRKHELKPVKQTTNNNDANLLFLEEKRGFMASCGIKSCFVNFWWHTDFWVESFRKQLL